MTPPHPDILTVRDAEILKLLQKVVEIGAYRKQWTAQHVEHAAQRWLVPKDAKVVPIHLVMAPVIAEDGVRLAELTQRQADVVYALCDGGLTNEEIAERLETTVGGIRQRLINIMSVLGARDRTQIVYLILSGEVRVVIKSQSNRKKAS